MSESGPGSLRLVALLRFGWGRGGLGSARLSIIWNRLIYYLIDLDQSDIRLEALVVLVLDYHPHPDARVIELECVIPVSVCRKPKLSIDVLTVGLKLRESLLELRNNPASSLDDHKVDVINPDPPLEIFSLNPLIAHPVQLLPVTHYLG